MSKVVLDENPIENHPRYQKVKSLNSGSFGAVIQARDKVCDKDVAIKFIERGEKITKNVEREVANHSAQRHPHIILYHEVFLTKDHVAIVMEFAEGGDLFSFLKKSGNRLKEPQARWFFQQLVFAVEYCHINNVILRDIKLENALIHWTSDAHPRPILKICDFGYSKHMRSQPRTQVGTLHYAAPEVFKAESGAYDQRADLWSLGVTLYILLVGAYPFLREEDKRTKDQMNKKMIRRILNGDYFIPKDIICSKEVKDLLSHLLVTDPNMRYTVEQVKKHPWFLASLPEGAIEMNSKKQREAYEEKFKCQQSKEEIEQVLQSARKVRDGTVHEALEEKDDEYDEMVDELVPQLNSTQLGQSFHKGTEAGDEEDGNDNHGMPLPMGEMEVKVDQ